MFIISLAFIKFLALDLQMPLFILNNTHDYNLGINEQIDNLIMWTTWINMYYCAVFDNGFNGCIFGFMEAINNLNWNR